MNRKQRSQSKIIRELPPELVQAVNDLLVNEHLTYQEITDFLTEQGHSISRSSVGRYGKNFLSKMEKLKIVREQAKTIIETQGDQAPMALADAGNQVAMQLLLEELLKRDDLGSADTLKLINSLALLERSGAIRERLKLTMRKKVDEAVRDIESKAAKNMSTEDLAHIKQVLYGLVESE